jgi:hypothetical protein
MLSHVDGSRVMHRCDSDGTGHSCAAISDNLFSYVVGPAGSDHEPAWSRWHHRRASHRKGCWITFGRSAHPGGPEPVFSPTAKPFRKAPAAHPGISSLCPPVAERQRRCADGLFPFLGDPVVWHAPAHTSPQRRRKSESKAKLSRPARASRPCCRSEAFCRVFP